MLGQLYDTIVAALNGKRFKDYKTTLQETVQERQPKQSPTGSRASPGRTMTRLFVVHVYLNGTLSGHGRGHQQKTRGAGCGAERVKQTRAESKNEEA